MTRPHTLAPILPCNDLDASEAFYLRLGFGRPGDGRVSADDDYRILQDADGASLHLARAVEGWLVPGRNPFGLYVYRSDVDRWAEAFRGQIIELEGPSDKPWGMYEFALSDPDSTLVRVGWPTGPRS